MYTFSSNNSVPKVFKVLAKIQNLTKMERIIVPNPIAKVENLLNFKGKKASFLLMLTKSVEPIFKVQFCNIQP